MTANRERSGSFYRAKAREIRQLVMRARSSEARIQLIGIAQLFDRMAAFVEGQTMAGKAVEEDLENQTAFMLLVPALIEMGGHP